MKGVVPIDSNRLRELRRQKALSLRELGASVGLAYDTINKLENGHRPARLSTVRKLANALDVEPLELMANRDQNSN